MAGSGNHQWDIVGKVVVTRTSPGPISDETWAQYIADIDNNELEYGLALCWGTLSISATQRSSVAEALKRQQVSGIVVTNDRMVRGIVVAVSWFGANIRAFSWAQVDRAVEVIQAPPDVLSQVLDIAVKFHEAVKQE